MGRCARYADAAPVKNAADQSKRNSAADVVNQPKNVAANLKNNRSVRETVRAVIRIVNKNYRSRLMSTSENLQKAFDGECQAIRKYSVFAKKAEADGYHGIAKLFRALAISETAHANSQLKVMDEIQSTRENLAAAIKVEEYESKGLYPKFIDQAKKENNIKAAECFECALIGEQVHFSLLIEALKRIESGEKSSLESIFVCSNCGNTTLEVPEVSCYVCGGTKDKIGQVD
jgi:rubrerythrin